MKTQPPRLTDASIKRLPAPAQGNRIFYDSEVTGLGCRVTAAGHRAFVLTYRSRAGVQRRYTVGAARDWSTTGAREEARRLKRLIDQGGDPLEEIALERGAPTVTDLSERFLVEHVSRKRPHTQAGYRAAVELYIQPAFGSLKVAAVAWGDIDALHRKITKDGRPAMANRTAAVASKMFALAVKWQMRSDNPVKGIERNAEQRRKRYTSAAEQERLAVALAAHPDQPGADVFRVCLLTGCRVGEAKAARWEDIDLVAGKWSKPGSTTKQRTDHEVPLSAAAQQLSAGGRRLTNSPCWVFPADSTTGHRMTVERSWRSLCRTANIHGLRIHDLRHSF